jgi:hypothetical protein
MYLPFHDSIPSHYREEYFIFMTSDEIKILYGQFQPPAYNFGKYHLKFTACRREELNATALIFSVLICEQNRSAHVTSELHILICLSFNKINALDWFLPGA